MHPSCLRRRRFVCVRRPYVPYRLQGIAPSVVLRMSLLRNNRLIAVDHNPHARDGAFCDCSVTAKVTASHYWPGFGTDSLLSPSRAWISTSFLHAANCESLGRSVPWSPFLHALEFWTGEEARQRLWSRSQSPTQAGTHAQHVHTAHCHGGTSLCFAWWFVDLALSLLLRAVRRGMSRGGVWAWLFWRAECHTPAFSGVGCGFSEQRRSPLL